MCIQNKHLTIISEVLVLLLACDAVCYSARRKIVAPPVFDWEDDALFTPTYMALKHVANPSNARAVFWPKLSLVTRVQVAPSEVL